MSSLKTTPKRMILAMRKRHIMVKAVTSTLGPVQSITTTVIRCDKSLIYNYSTNITVINNNQPKHNSYSHNIMEWI